MATSVYPSLQDRVFRPHSSIVGCKIVVLLALGAGVLLAGIAHAAIIAVPIAGFSSFWRCAARTTN